MYFPCFLSCLSGVVGWRGASRVEHRAVAAIATIALAWSVVSSLWIYPHSLSYFNESTGGPTRGHFHLVDSNVDWGQDLLYLKRWLREHPEARPLRIAYFPSIIGTEFAGILRGMASRGPLFAPRHGNGS